MKLDSKLIALAAACAFAGCSGQPAPNSQSTGVEGTSTSVRSRDAWEAEYSEMTSTLGLGVEESQALRTAFEAREAEVGAWLKGERGARLVQLEGDLKRATQNKDLAGMQRIMSEAGPLRRELESLVNSHEASVLGSLSLENQQRWRGHLLAQELIELMQPLNLDITQQQYIRDNAAAAIQAAVQAGQPNPKAAAFLEFERWVEDTILNADQRKAYQAIKQKNAIRSLGW